MDMLLLPPILGGVGLLVALIIYFIVKSYPAGEGLVTEIADAIHGFGIFCLFKYPSIGNKLALFKASKAPLRKLAIT